MADVVERFTVDELLSPHASARVMRPDLRSVELHWHDFYELCLVTSGHATHLVNGERQDLVAGTAFLLSPADVHEIASVDGGPVECFNVVIEVRAMEAQFARMGAALPGPLPWIASGVGDLEDLFAHLHRESEGSAFGAAALTDALVTELLVRLARAREPGAWRGGADDKPGGAPVDDDVRRAVSFVDRNFREPITLADVARQAHLSPNYVSERFGQVAGSSFQSYLQERRLRFAHSLLQSTRLGVTEVCHAAGFNSLSHFGRAYRRRYGAPPSAGRPRTATRIAL